MAFNPKAIEEAIKKSNVSKAPALPAVTEDLGAVKEITEDDNSDATPMSNATDIDVLGAGMLILRDLIKDVDAKVMKLAEVVTGGNMGNSETVAPATNDMQTAEALPEREV